MQTGNHFNEFCFPSQSVLCRCAHFTPTTSTSMNPLSPHTSTLPMNTASLPVCTDRCHECVPHRLGIPAREEKRDEVQTFPVGARPRRSGSSGECWSRSHQILTGYINTARNEQADISFDSFVFLIQRALAEVFSFFFFFLFSGDKVIPLFLPQCGECERCLSPKTNHCRKNW